MTQPLAPGETWRLTVYGKPAPQGSKDVGVVLRKGQDGQLRPVFKDGRPVTYLRESNPRTAPWRQELTLTAIAEWHGRPPLDVPVAVTCTFYVQRPQAHYGTGRNAGKVKLSAPAYPGQSGYDVDKLVRAVLDSLTGVVLTDDRRVVSLTAKRRWGQPRAEICVRVPKLTTVQDALAPQLEVTDLPASMLRGRQVVDEGLAEADAGQQLVVGHPV